MRIAFLLLIFLAGLVPEMLGQQDGGSPITVLEFKWYRDLKSAPKKDTSRATPAREMIPENRKFQREARAQLSPGAIDPNTQTIDGRSEAMEKIVQESRTPPAKAVEGFTYHAKLRNDADTGIDVVFLEFQFIERANSANVVRRQFLCAARMKPRGIVNLHVFSSLGPSDVISVESLSNDAGNLFNSKVNVNRIEYSNGAIIQRKDWNFSSFKASIDNAVSTPWRSEVCRPI